MKKLLLVLTILCIVLPSCKKTTITLSVDKTEITADGVDVATFKVIDNKNEDVTKDARIFYAGTDKELGGSRFSTTEPKTYSFYATYEDATSEKVVVKAIVDGGGNDDEETVVVELSVSKTSIVADGKDAAVFNVTANGDALTENYQILNVADSSLVENGTFVTTEAGNYTFVALYNKVYSNEVTVEAKAVEEPKPVLKLVADKTEIYNDGVDKVTFTVFSDENELSDGYKILNIDKNTLLESNVYSSTEVYACSFVAILEDDEEVKSNEVTINVIVKPDPVVELKVDKTAIKNNGVDKVTFTVLVDGEDRTAESVIIDVTFGGGVYEGGTTFSSKYKGDYYFQAEWNEYRSEMVLINVYEALVYKPGDLYDVNGVKGVVFYVDETGTSGLIMSMDQAYLQWSTEYVWVNCATNRGDWHTEDMLKLGADKYPAAKWCADHGEGWYFPSSHEMHLMWDAVSNGTHEWAKDYVKLYNDKLDDPISEDYYWSSNETSENMAEVIAFMGNSVVCLDPVKTSKFNVRAVHKF